MEIVQYFEKFGLTNRPSPYDKQNTRFIEILFDSEVSNMKKLKSQMKRECETLREFTVLCTFQSF